MNNVYLINYDYKMEELKVKKNVRLESRVGKGGEIVGWNHPQSSLDFIALRFYNCSRTRVTE